MIKVHVSFTDNLKRLNPVDISLFQYGEYYFIPLNDKAALLMHNLRNQGISFTQLTETIL